MFASPARVCNIVSLPKAKPELVVLFKVFPYRKVFPYTNNISSCALSPTSLDPGPEQAPEFGIPGMVAPGTCSAAARHLCAQRLSQAPQALLQHLALLG